MEKTYGILWFVVSLICVLHLLYRYLVRKSARETEKKQKISRIKSILQRNKPLLIYYSEQAENFPARLHEMPFWFRKEASPLRAAFEEVLAEYRQASEAIAQKIIDAPEDLDVEGIEIKLDHYAHTLQRSEDAFRTFVNEMYAATFGLDTIYGQIQKLAQHLLQAAIAIPDAEDRADFKNKIGNELRAADDYFKLYDEITDPRPLASSLQLIKEKIIAAAEILNRAGKANLIIPEQLKK